MLLGGVRLSIASMGVFWSTLGGCCDFLLPPPPPSPIIIKLWRVRPRTFQSRGKVGAICVSSARTCSLSRIAQGEATLYCTERQLQGEPHGSTPPEEVLDTGGHGVARVSWLFGTSYAIPLMVSRGSSSGYIYIYSLYGF